LKKVIFAILITVMIVMAVPATAFAAGPSHYQPYHKAPASAMSADIILTATNREINIHPIARKFVLMIGTVYYQGTVGNAAPSELEGAYVEAEEHVIYLTDLNGNILVGKGMGSLQITTATGDGSAVVNFTSDISGNIAVGNAYDEGAWKVAQSYGSINFIYKAKGTWSAIAYLVPTGYPSPNDYTFQAYATFTGTY
jgi:hypothetical protein